MHKACCISFSRHRGEGKYVDMSENEFEKRVAYEVSVSKLELVEDDGELQISENCAMMPEV